jgi:ectoine hydroxylase-related dioxygenase (phytanoyl-CoA dioxygenase family)
MNPDCAFTPAALDGFDQFERNGFQVIKSLVRTDECDGLTAELTPLFEERQKAAGGPIGGLRNLLRSSPQVLQFASSARLVSLLEKAGGASAFAVRAIFFDKNPEANWLVPWHQDVAIPVRSRIETPGFTGWSIKEGVLHVHPPREILEGMFTVRLHLDDCSAGNGALRVLPGSHLCGKLDASEIARWTTSNQALVCELSKGDALVMRPLLLHSSPPADRPAHRRVLHIEYATRGLPEGLNWCER